MHAQAHPHRSHRIGAHLQARLADAHSGMFGLARHADLYDGLPGRLARPLYRRIAEEVAAAGLPDGTVVLDVGTGPGRLPLLIAERCPGVVVEGIDLAAAMVDRARRAAAEAGLSESRVTFRVADVAALPHPDASVDLVVSSISLHHWTDPQAGLAEIARVLRPGGRAWIYDARPVLRRVARTAARRGHAVTLDPFRAPSATVTRPAGIPGALVARLLARLTLTSPDLPSDPAR